MGEVLYAQHGFESGLDWRLETGEIESKQTEDDLLIWCK